MKARPWMVAALCLGGLVAWTRADQAAVTRRYKLEMKNTVTQDLSTIGQGSQTQAFSNAAFVTVNAVDSAGGQAVTVVMDSLVPGEGSPIPADSAKGAAGATWHGFRGTNGRIGDLTLDGANQSAQVVTGILPQLFPPMKAGTKEGQTWTDTTDSENNGVAIRTVTNFQTSTDTFEGGKVIRLAGAFSNALSGTQDTPNGSLEIEGTGTGNASWLVAGDGTCMQATHLATQQFTVTMAQLPAPIPVSVKTEGMATLLK